MNTQRLQRISLATALATALAACGGGGGGGGGTSATPAPPPAPAPVPAPTFIPLPDMNRTFIGEVVDSAGVNRAGVHADGFDDGLFLAWLGNPNADFLSPATSITVGRAQLINNTATSQTLGFSSGREYVFSNLKDSRVDMVDMAAGVRLPGFLASDGSVGLEGPYLRKPATEGLVSETIRMTARAPTTTGLKLEAIAGQYQGVVTGSDTGDVRSSPLQEQPLVITPQGDFTAVPVPGCTLTGSVQFFPNRLIARLLPNSNSNCSVLGTAPTAVIVNVTGEGQTRILSIAYVGIGAPKAYFGVYRLPVMPA